MSQPKCLLLLLFYPFIIYSQIGFNSILYDTSGTYKYITGNIEPDNQWRDAAYDDNSWITGYKSIGYGDEDDSTLIDTTTSLYLRYTFNVNDTTDMRKASLMVDFDDGFIAYLNGIEIVRVNLGQKGDTVLHDGLTERSHEAYFYRNYFRPVCSYLIDTNIFRPGKNVLAVQVHNDSINGSDLSFACDLFVINDYYNFWHNYSNYIKQVPVDSTKLPVIIINTNEYGIPEAHKRYVAHMGIINGNEFNKPADTFTDYDGRIYMELRGKSTRDYPKKSFNIETQDSLGNNLNVPLLGMPAENDWILFGPFADRSQIRNEIIFNIGRKQGHYEPRTRFCEFILNGENMGLYILTEKIKRDNDRVDIAKLKPTENAGDSLTGGYLMEYKGFYDILYPKSDLITENQNNYINNFLNEYQSITDSPYFLDNQSGYKKYIDEQSLIDYIIVNELSKNCDAYYLSTFLYKDRDDRDGRLKYGPLWDYDLAFGNANYQNGQLINGWQFEENDYLNITKYLRDTSLVNQLAGKWYQLRSTGYLNTDSLMFLIDSLVLYIREPLARNNDIWRTIGKDIFFFQDELSVGQTYDEEITIMKNWLLERIEWIDNHISDLHYDFVGVEPMYTENFMNIKVYPNPFKENLFIEISADNTEKCIIQLFDQFGRTVYSEQSSLHERYNEIEIEGNNLGNLKNGIYLILIKNKNQTIFRGKIMKVN